MGRPNSQGSKSPVRENYSGQTARLQPRRLARLSRTWHRRQSRRSKQLQRPPPHDWDEAASHVDSTSMTRSTPATNARRASQEDLNAWMNGDPPLDEHSTHLLAAYREALSLANARENTDDRNDSAQEPEKTESNSQPDVMAVTADEGDPSTNIDPSAPSATSPPKPRAVTSVLRLDDVEGIAPDQMARLHGRLIAMGYLTEELVGRTGGVAYRLTRDGLQRLNHEELSKAA